MTTYSGRTAVLKAREPTAFETLLRGAKGGRFKKLDNRYDLWQVLAKLTILEAVFTDFPHDQTGRDINE